MSVERSNLSVVIPVYNEGRVVLETVTGVCGELERQGLEYEVIVINDGSTDKFPSELSQPTFTFARRVAVHNNLENMGYGYSLKRGISVAKFDTICILDADGTYPIKDISKLREHYMQGFDMVVGARTGKHLNSGFAKYLGRKAFILISEFTTGCKIKDINSGFRIFRKDIALRYRDILSSRFSFTTTITILFMQESLFVKYVDIDYYKRTGRTKVKHVRDAWRALQLITHCILVANPLKLYLLIGQIYLLLMIIPLLLVFYTSAILAGILTVILSGLVLITCIGFLATQNMLNRKLGSSA